MTGVTRILRPLLAALSVTAGLLVAEAGPALACSCRADRVVADDVAASEGAFVGVYTGRDDPEAQGPLISSAREVLNHFEVGRIVKGDIGERVDVGAAASGASCGLELQAGARTGLLLRREADGWKSSLCDQIEPDVLLAAAPGRVPAGAGAGAGTGPDWGLILFAGLLVLAVPVAYVVGGWRRRSP